MHDYTRRIITALGDPRRLTRKCTAQCCEVQHNDSQTPIQQAFLLQQKLIEVRHPDHTMITYPDLGHLFYPSSQWVTAVGGPVEPKVLEDLFGWLSDPVRNFKESTILSSQIH